MEFASSAVAHKAQDRLVVGASGMGHANEIAKSDGTVFVVAPRRQFDRLVVGKCHAIWQRIAAEVFTILEQIDSLIQFVPVRQGVAGRNASLGGDILDVLGQLLIVLAVVVGDGIKFLLETLGLLNMVGERGDGFSAQAHEFIEEIMILNGEDGVAPSCDNDQDDDPANQKGLFHEVG